MGGFNATWILVSSKLPTGAAGGSSGPPPQTCATSGKQCKKCKKRGQKTQAGRTQTLNFSRHKRALYRCAIRKDAGLCCGSRLRKGDVFTYGRLPQHLKDLKAKDTLDDLYGSNLQTLLNKHFKMSFVFPSLLWLASPMKRPLRPLASQLLCPPPRAELGSGESCFRLKSDGGARTPLNQGTEGQSKNQSVGILRTPTPMAAHA